MRESKKEKKGTDRGEWLRERKKYEKRYWKIELTDRHWHDGHNNDGKSEVLAKAKAKKVTDVIPTSDNWVMIGRHSGHFKVIFIVLLFFFDEVITLSGYFIENKTF